MALESAKKFLADAAADKSLENKIDNGNKVASQDEKLAAVVSAAKAEGYDFTVDELKEAALSVAEISADELKNVAASNGRCVAFASGDCTCFGDGGHCTCFGSGCKAVLT